MALPTRRRERDLTSWDPVSDVERTARQMSQFFEQAFRNLPGFDRGPEEAFAPLADLEETDDAYVMEIELPGVSRDDIDIECRGRRITVSGERREQERKGVVRQRTRTVGRFFHEVVLPGDIEEDNIGATLENGVLTVRAPKDEAEQQRTRKIDIS